MAEAFEPRPLPTVHDYADAARHVNGMLTPSPEFTHKLLEGQINLTESSQRFAAMATKLGVLIEPVDAETSEPLDPEARTAQAFLLGSLAGIMVARELHGPHLKQSELYGGVPSFPVPSNVPKNEFRYAYSEEILEYGRTGIERIGAEAADTLEDIGYRVAEDVRSQSIFMKAVGIVTLTAYTIHETAIENWRRASIQDAVDAPADIDWDAGLQALTGNGD